MQKSTLLFYVTCLTLGGYLASMGYGAGTKEFWIIQIIVSVMTLSFATSKIRS